MLILNFVVTSLVNIQILCYIQGVAALLRQKLTEIRTDDLKMKTKRITESLQVAAIEAWKYFREC